MSNPNFFIRIACTVFCFLFKKKKKETRLNKKHVYKLKINIVHGLLKDVFCFLRPLNLNQMGFRASMR